MNSDECRRMEPSFGFTKAVEVCPETMVLIESQSPVLVPTMADESKVAHTIARCVMYG
jgi:hypothetical protein